MRATSRRHARHTRHKCRFAVAAPHDARRAAPRRPASHDPTTRMTTRDESSHIACAGAFRALFCSRLPYASRRPIGHDHIQLRIRTDAPPRNTQAHLSRTCCPAMSAACRQLHFRRARVRPQVARDRVPSRASTTWHKIQTPACTPKHPSIRLPQATRTAITEAESTDTLVPGHGRRLVTRLVVEEAQA